MSGGADQFWVIPSTTDATGRCTHLDEQWRAFTGQSVKEALDFGWLAALHPDDRPKTIEMLQAALDERKPFRCEFRVRRADGVHRWALAVGAPRFGDGDAFLGYVGSIVDVDDRRATEAATAASEERQAFLLKLSDALRPLADPLDVQRQAARILGMRLKATRVHYGEVTEDGAWGVVREDYCDGVPSVVGKYNLDSYGPLITAEFRAGRTLVIDDVANGERLTPAEREATAGLQIGAYVIAPLFKAGRPAAVVVVHHVAPHRWTTDELVLIEATADRIWEAVERALAEERRRAAYERLTATLRASPVHVWEQDRDLRYVWVQNPGLGHSADEVVGKTDADLFECREDAAAIAAVKRGVVDSGTPARREVHAFSEGASRWFDLTVEPRFSDDAVVGVLCTATDVTERKRAEEELRRGQESLALAVDAAQMGTWDLDLTRDFSGPRNLRHDQIFGYETRQEQWGGGDRPTPRP